MPTMAAVVRPPPLPLDDGVVCVLRTNTMSPVPWNMMAVPSQLTARCKTVPASLRPREQQRRQHGCHTCSCLVTDTQPCVALAALTAVLVDRAAQLAGVGRLQQLDGQGIHSVAQHLGVHKHIHAICKAQAQATGKRRREMGWAGRQICPGGRHRGINQATTAASTALALRRTDSERLRDCHSGPPPRAAGFGGLRCRGLCVRGGGGGLGGGGHRVLLVPV